MANDLVPKSLGMVEFDGNQFDLIPSGYFKTGLEVVKEIAVENKQDVILRCKPKAENLDTIKGAVTLSYDKVPASIETVLDDVKMLVDSKSIVIGTKMVCGYTSNQEVSKRQGLQKLVKARHGITLRQQEEPKKDEKPDQKPALKK